MLNPFSCSSGELAYKESGSSYLNSSSKSNLEALMLITLAALVILFGFYPAPLMDTLNVSVNNLISNYEIAIQTNGLN